MQLLWQIHEYNVYNLFVQLPPEQHPDPTHQKLDRPSEQAAK
jgi:hypothetical protein